MAVLHDKIQRVDHTTTVARNTDVTNFEVCQERWHDLCSDSQQKHTFSK